MRCALQKETSKLCTLLSCKKGNLNNAPNCKQFFFYTKQKMWPLYMEMLISKVTMPL